jgi:integrase/recombinase XerC/integrase/recombinase XerD
MNPEKLELSELVDKFLVHKRSEGWSERTVEWYQQALGLFQAWLEEEGMSTRLDDLGEDEMRLFILHLKGRPGLRGPASSHTVNSRVRAVRAFFNWPYEEDYTECHRLLKVRPPKPRELEIEILTDEEIERTFASINPHTVLGARNTAIYSLMLDTGLRLTEVVTLKYQDAHLDNRYVKILGKGDKERIVAFGTTCQRALLNYVQHWRVGNEREEGETLFLCIDGHPMGAEALRSLTERLSKTAGIPRLHPHLIRHTYATRFLLNGGNVFLLKQNLGHTSLAMVERYVHIASQMAAVVSQGFSPLDRVEQPRAGRQNRRPRVSTIMERGGDRVGTAQFTKTSEVTPFKSPLRRGLSQSNRRSGGR